jgi:Flp pilus assembly protein TadB
MKRHYNNGYYISHNKGKQTTIVSNDERKTAKLSKINILQAEQALQKEETNNKTIAENSPLIVSNEKISYKTISKQHVKQLQAIQAKIVEKRAEQMKHIVFEIPKNNNALPQRDELSLFWIIILAILILCAIGVLGGGFGLGGLIYLLLVVALILLVLWLLRLL